MFEDDDLEILESDIESRNWNKLQENMKLIGFREGAVKGKDLSLQEGFNAGYSDGFKLGECLGMAKAVISQSQSGPTKYELDVKSYELSRKNCILCSESSEERRAIMSTQSKQIKGNFDEFLSSQQSHIDEVITNLKKSDLKLYFDKG